jgi:predicted SAM-dependent methyltransferase
MATATTAPAQTGLRLHLGCGTVFAPGWENIDKSPNVYLSRTPRLRRALARVGILSEAHTAANFAPGTIRVDLSRGLPYADRSTAYVYHSHLIEHMARWQGLALMRECLRVLEPGGTMRAATPNLRTIVDWYLRDDFPFGEGPAPADRFMDVLGTYRDVPGSTAQRLVRKLVSGVPHQWLYDRESLSVLLEEAGFVDPVERGYREGSVPELDALEHRPESLFIEARRP